MKQTIFSFQPNISDTEIPCYLRHCAAQLLSQASVTVCDALLQDLASDSVYLTFLSSHPELNTVQYTYRSGEDLLGRLYQSLCDRKSKKHSGSYYTPVSVIHQMITKHLPTFYGKETVFDPSCGSGAFLLQIPAHLPLTNLYGNDSDPLCITLTRINLALNYRIRSKEELDILYHNFTISDFLSADGSFRTVVPSAGFHLILGNPPWGAALTEEQKRNYRSHFSCANKRGTEIFDLFIEQSLRYLAPDGILSFVLPEALFSVKLHAPVRNLLMNTTQALSVEYLGDVFSGVYCPSVILTLKENRSGEFYQDTVVTAKTHSHVIKESRSHDTGDAFSFSLTDEEYRLLKKIRNCPNCATLQDNADFALGIVTGNNAKWLSQTASPGMEPVIKGKDISKYHILSVSGYLSFHPEQFQQTAPTHLYRAKEKLFYRFINRQLIFAYDDTGLLSLNSCNIVIPRMEGLSMKYVMAILNSGVAQFFFEKQFTSVKVLRSHLEAIPIPLADPNTQEGIVALVKILIQAETESEEYQNTYRRLDKKIAELYGLTEREYTYIYS